jgi:argininosuccinate lyase
MRTLWGAGFEEDTNQLVARFSQSVHSDLTFWQEDVIGSVAHARMLGDNGIISREESNLLIKGLEQIHEEGPDRLPKDVEDIHTAVEVRLREIVGDVAGKLNTARSRNDQIATDTRLFLHNELLRHLDLLKKLQRTLISLAEKHKDDLMPGYTHTQRAQPVTLGFHLLAHFWALQRHGYRAERLTLLANFSPLGANVLAGTSFPINRDQTSDELGFTAPIPNALDATSDRSYILDALHLCAQTMIDLSRLSQELVLWSSREYGFVTLSESVTTGSSVLPQKRNPDMAELIRGRAGKAIGNYVALATALKGLPLGYNRDTQDDKPPLFESLKLTRDAIRLSHLMLETATWHTDRMREAVRGDFSTATDLADALAARGVPFREAFEQVAKFVRHCEESGISLEDATMADLHHCIPEANEADLVLLQPEESVRRRNSFGAPGPEAMRIQLERATAVVEAEGFAELA